MIGYAASPLTPNEKDDALLRGAAKGGAKGGGGGARGDAGGKGNAEGRRAGEGLPRTPDSVGAEEGAAGSGSWRVSPTRTGGS